MANDPRVINLNASKLDPDSSGVGAMLFDQMIKQPNELKQTDAIEGIRAKYKAEAAAQANQFDQGMATLRSQLATQSTQAMWEHEQALRQQEATGLSNLVGQASGQGINIPGLTHPTEGTPEAGIAGVPQANEINPNALPEARSMFAEAYKSHVAGMTEANKEQLHRTLGLTDSNDALQANQLADHFEAYNDKKSADEIRAAYGTPGLADHATWQKVQQYYGTKLATAQATIASKMAIAKEITQRQLEVAQIKTSVQRALAQTRVDDKGFTQLQQIHSGIQSNLGRLTQIRNQLLQSQIMADPAKSQEYQSEIDRIDGVMKDLNEQGVDVRAKMDEWHNARNPGPARPTPASVVPPANPSAPGSWGKATRVR